MEAVTSVATRIQWPWNRAANVEENTVINQNSYCGSEPRTVRGDGEPYQELPWGWDVLIQNSVRVSSGLLHLLLALHEGYVSDPCSALQDSTAEQSLEKIQD
ncbi:hypothetical protein DM860_003048 [Cuscuta australis]|uniref:Uncharacterized protein n=1 Tax=Cuscuta australis TaxID=267555 RepID=A0A328D184_9ASTE|nr:hypothetical protein DM860_003048 [Cuscuta australis]